MIYILDKSLWDGKFSGLFAGVDDLDFFLYSSKRAKYKLPSFNFRVSVEYIVLDIQQLFLHNLVLVSFVGFR